LREISKNPSDYNRGNPYTYRDKFLIKPFNYSKIVNAIRNREIKKSKELKYRRKSINTLKN
jgi:hypothetical protein